MHLKTVYPGCTGCSGCIVGHSLWLPGIAVHSVEWGDAVFPGSRPHACRNQGPLASR